MGMMNLFKAIILVQLFYAFAITLVTYSMPAESLDYVTSFSDITGTVNLESTSQQIQESVTDQTNIPVVEIGALIFFSGNIIIDLLLNFAFAIPQMLATLINGMEIIVQQMGSTLNADISNIVQLFASVVIMVLYFVGIIQLLTSIRSGRTIT
jgi:hypothetical protein